MLYRQGAHPEAMSLYRAALDTFRQTLGADASLTLGAQLGLAQNLNGVGDFRGAEATAREALAVYRKQPTNQQVVTVLMALGDSLAGQRRFKEAIPYLREANALFDKGGPRRTPWYKPEAQSSLGAALAGYGQSSGGGTAPPCRVPSPAGRGVDAAGASPRVDRAADRFLRRFGPPRRCGRVEEAFASRWVNRPACGGIRGALMSRSFLFPI